MRSKKPAATRRGTSGGAVTVASASALIEMKEGTSLVNDFEHATKEAAFYERFFREYEDLLESRFEAKGLEREGEEEGWVA